MKDEIDILIKNGMIISNEEELKDHSIAVKNGKILEVDTNRKIERKYKPKKTIDASGKIVMPGIIDGHIHNAQIMLRGSISDKLISLPPIWMNYLIPFEEKLSYEQVKTSSLFSMLNMIKSGITSFVEAGGPKPNKIAEATEKTGMRGIITKSTIDTDPEIPMYQETQEIINEYEDLLERWNGVDDRIKVWPSLREIMLNSLDLYDGLFDLANKYDTKITMHLAESRTEVDYTLEKYGKRPVELMYDKGYLDDNVIASHMIFVNDKEMNMIDESNSSIVWCPSVDAMVMGPSRVNLMLERGNSVVFGSDGGEWNNLDLFEQSRQGRITAKLQSNSLYHEKTSLNTNRTFKMLTKFSENIIGEPVGKIEENYKADIIILDPKTNLIPRYNKINTVINMANSDNVETTIINGNIIMENNEIKKFNENKVIEDAKKLQKDLKGDIQELKKEFKTGK